MKTVALPRPGALWWRRALVTGVTLGMVVAATAGWWWPALHDEPATLTTAPIAAAPLSDRQYAEARAAMSAILHDQGSDRLFSYVRDRFAGDASFARSCHALMHLMGHEAYDEFGGYPEAMAHQSEVCNSGFTHGIIEAFFGSTDDVGAALAEACQTDAPQNFQSWQCFHGSGHGVMQATDRDIMAAMAGCQQFDTDFAAGSCVNGALMEHFTVVDHLGGRRTDATDSTDVCRGLAESYRLDCYYYAPLAYLPLHGDDFAAAYRWCQSAGRSDAAAACVSGLGGQAMERTGDNAGAVARYCGSLETSHRQLCVRGAVDLYINQRGSSQAAAPLCEADFRSYRQICQLAIKDKHERLSI